MPFKSPRQRKKVMKMVREKSQVYKQAWSYGPWVIVRHVSGKYIAHPQGRQAGISDPVEGTTLKEVQGKIDAEGF